MTVRTLILSCALVIAFRGGSQSRIDCGRIAYQVSEWITYDSCDFIMPYLDSTYRTRTSAVQFSEMWSKIQLNYGAGFTKGRVQLEDRNGFLIATRPLTFPRIKYLVLVTFNDQGKIINLYLCPSGGQYEPPDYVNTLDFNENELSVGDSTMPLSGRITIPVASGKLPLVIMVQGAGPQDMDGSYGANKIYRDIAWGLASNGIAVIRFPKRTSVYGSLYLNGNPNIRYTLEEEYINDIKDAVRKAKSNPLIDSKRIFLLGHSQGADAVIIAARQLGGIKGLVLASSSPRRIQDLMCEQLDYINGYEPPYAYRRIKGEEIKRHLEYSMRSDLDDHTPLDSLPMNISAGYWKYLNQMNVIQDLKSMPDVRLLFLQGARDYQTTMLDYRMWFNEFGQEQRATFKLYPWLNQMYFKGYGRPTASEYEERHSVDEEPVKDIADWIKNIHD